MRFPTLLLLLFRVHAWASRERSVTRARADFMELRPTASGWRNDHA